MRIAITGSTGFIGGKLVKHFSANHQVVAMQRNECNPGGYGEVKKFDLTDEKTFSAIEGADVLVHCAFIRSDRNNKNALAQNVEGTLKLARLCAEKKIHFVFLSTMSAHADALSDYGKHKFEIEQQLPKDNTCILKLGLVIGNSGGLFNTIKSIISKSSFIPMIDGGAQPIQIVHVSDLCRIIEKICSEKISGTFNIGTPKVYQLKELYEQIALAEKKYPKFISVPYPLMNIALTVAELLPVQLPVTTENLRGLKQLKPFNTENSLKKLGVELMSLEPAVSIS